MDSSKIQPILLAIACGVITLGGWTFATFPDRFRTVESKVIRLEEKAIQSAQADAVHDQRLNAMEEQLKKVEENNFIVKYLKDRWDKWEDSEADRRERPIQ